MRPLKRLAAAIAAAASICGAEAAAQVPHALSTGDYTQTFPNTIDDGAFGWNNAEAITGYRVASAPPPDPAAYLTRAGLTEYLLANFPNPSAPAAPSGILGFFPLVEIPDFSATADGSGAIFYSRLANEFVVLEVLLDATNRRNLTFDLTFVEGTASASGPTIAQLQYRIGGSGAYTNVAGARVADINAGGGAGAMRSFGMASGAGGPVALPPALDGQAQIALRVVISSPTGAGDSFSIDDIVVTSVPMAAPGGPVGAPFPGWTAAAAASGLLAAWLLARRRRWG